ncbi:hypothetical protein [Nocardia beijingensis]|uniref:hypothetical protein n=1 Tax=Nocardia beijingensis TaxID=95162 RepID=UPI0033B94B9F
MYRQFQPEIIATANDVCGILRTDPTPAGKRAALDHLAVDHYPRQWATPSTPWWT